MFYNLFFQVQNASVDSAGGESGVVIRCVLAALTAFIVSVLAGSYIIKKLKKFNIGEDTSKTDSETLAALHEGKKDTPTMGGIIIVLGLVGSALLWCNLQNGFVLLSIAATISFGLLGFIDDYIKLTKKHAAGLTWRTKLSFQLAMGLALGLVLYFCYGGIEGFTSFSIPFFAHHRVNIGPLYIIAIPIFIASTSNAVNLTDGLDGLATGCTIITTAVLIVITYLVGHTFSVNYLQVLHVPGCAELSVFCSAMLGVGLGFLWYNCFPAQVFMGNTGSLLIGGVFGFIAAVSKQELLMLLIGAVFFIEMFSVMIQVGFYKLSGGKRIFRCAPLHHHFQFAGWTETKITSRFFILAAVLAAFGFAGFTFG